MAELIVKVTSTGDAAQDADFINRETEVSGVQSANVGYDIAAAQKAEEDARRAALNPTPANTLNVGGGALPVEGETIAVRRLQVPDDVAAKYKDQGSVVSLTPQELLALTENRVNAGKGSDGQGEEETETETVETADTAAEKRESAPAGTAVGSGKAAVPVSNEELYERGTVQPNDATPSGPQSGLDSVLDAEREGDNESASEFDNEQDA